MRVLGLDPGGMAMVDCGAVSVSSKIPVEQRLSTLYERLGEIVARYQPDEVAIEEPFVAGNARSALAIGRAQAIAILAAANRKLPVFRYLPTKVKQQVTNYGASSKEQVQEMVRIQLGLTEVPKSSDAADALAVAICHLHQRHLDQLLAESQ